MLYAQHTQFNTQCRRECLQTEKRTRQSDKYLRLSKQKRHSDTQEINLIKR
uniref:Uncharacterized protein n=1 Tax=Arion vulgaris TaxID=1028688 RepID=A0A0B7BVJ0_9EUPU